MVAAPRMAEKTIQIVSKRPGKQVTERAKRIIASPRSQPGDGRRISSAKNLPPMAGKNRWKPRRCIIDLPDGGSRAQTEEEAWEDARSVVRHYMMVGFSQEIIAKLMHPTMDPTTLRRHFRHELDVGKETQVARLAGTAYQLAVTGRDPAMLRFLLQTKGGFSSDSGDRAEGPILVQSIPGDEGL